MHCTALLSAAAAALSFDLVRILERVSKFDPYSGLTRNIGHLYRNSEVRNSDDVLNSHKFLHYIGIKQLSDVFFRYFL